MSRRVVRRVFVAPLVIAIATASVPPALLPSQITEWAAETFDVSQTGASIARVSEQMSETWDFVLRLPQTAATRLGGASDYLFPARNSEPANVEPETKPGARVMVAALPPPKAQEAAASGSIPYIAFAPLTGTPEPAEETVTGAITGDATPSQPASAAEEPVIASPELAATPEIAVVASEPVAAAAVIAAPPLTPEVLAPDVAAMPAPEPQPVPAAPIALRETDPAPPVVATTRAGPEEKQVFASLGRQATAVDMTPIATPDPALAPASASEPQPPSAQIVEEHGVEFGHAAHGSRPLKLRALTRADIPSAEKLASLGGPVRGDHRLPPEQERVAHDDPVMTEMPISIGRRKWIDESKYTGLGSPEALLEALRHLGSNARTLGLPASLWCADFMNLVLRKSGIPATGSRAAKSYLQYGKKIDEPRVGAIAIFTRGKNGGHIGIVRGTDGNGNPIIVSGNHNNKVAEAIYPKARVIAYVVPK